MRSLIILHIILILSACSSMNIPPKLNAPTVEKKGDLEVEIGASTNSFYQNVNYAISDNLLLTSSGHISYDNFWNMGRWDLFDYLTVTPDPYINNYIDVGFGGYWIKDWNVPTFRSYRFQALFAGVGVGYSEDMFKNTYGSSFIQYNIGRHSTNLQYGLALRASYLYYPYMYHVYRQYNQPESIEKKTYHIFGIEPLFYISWGKNRLRYSFNCGFYKTTKNDESGYSSFVSYPQNTLVHLSFGIKYCLFKK